MDTIVSYWSGVAQTLWNVARTFSFKDAIDVLVVTALLYVLIKLLRESRAGQLVKGILVLVVLFLISSVLDLMMVNAVLSQVFQFAIIVAVILFQPEIRKILEQFGSSGRSLASVVGLRERDEKQAEARRAIEGVVEAATMLQQMRMGALMVFERATRLGEIAATGTVVNADPQPQLIANIFFNKAPLHDGAMILRDGRVYAAGCILPLTANNGVSAELGTRHRAALGMSENSDAIVVVVSEETGQISLAENGRLTRDYTRLTLREALENALLGRQEKTGTGRRRLFERLFGAERKGG